MAETAFSILVADDDEVIRETLKESFANYGYECVAAKDGQEAFDAALKHHPDLMLLDYKMPLKSGGEVAMEIRKYPGFTNTPIVILTAQTAKAERIKIMAQDIDDLICKPTDEDEIVARIKMLLKRSLQRIDVNPLTKLPGNPSIQARIEKEIKSGRKFAVIYADLDNFKAYNDAYGFEAGDVILLKTADLITKAAYKFDKDAFVGNIGGDDFVAVTCFEAAMNTAQEITEQMEKMAPQFYNEADRAKGFITRFNRRGEGQNFPLLSISVSVVHNNLKPLISYAQVSFIASELKHYAKSWEGNFVAFDRRNH
ncbi:MAG: response regulator [Elusimicrobiota bacterium]|jgi:diguanylate cyclase (GGDEF)-like protein|nr:response regulator [Elusimicrobiota bacterium]